MKEPVIITWGVLPFKESMAFHWCDTGSVLVKNELVHRFNVFCRKSDCKCFVEDLELNTMTEFDGRKLEGIRMCKKDLGQ